MKTFKERYSELLSLTNGNIQEQWEDIAIETMEYLDQAIELLEAHTALFDTVSDGDFSVKNVANYPQDVKRFIEKGKMGSLITYYRR
jgi:hypothetical protein